MGIRWYDPCSAKTADTQVVANAVTALADIHEASLNLPPSRPSSPNGSSPPPSARPAQSSFIIDPPTLSKLLVALNECSEWGRIAILTTLARYKAQDVEESEHICERVLPQFQHVNAAVVLGAVKVIMIHMKNVHRDDLLKQLTRKMAPPLGKTQVSRRQLTFSDTDLVRARGPMGGAAQHQFAVAEAPRHPRQRDEGVFLQVQRSTLRQGREARDHGPPRQRPKRRHPAGRVERVRVRGGCRFCPESGPGYRPGRHQDRVGGGAMCRGVDGVDRNKSQLRGAGSGHRHQGESGPAQRRTDSQDIFRRYPHSYEGIIPTLCSNLEELDEPEAKASLIWIIGEYAEKIDNADELLGVFLEAFKEESYPVRVTRSFSLSSSLTRLQVQLQTLTAIVKLFLKKPDESQAVVQRVLQAATKDCDSPDVRDRAYIYWRLLSSDPAAAKVSKSRS